MNRWRRVARVAAHAVAVVTILVCLLLPTSRYDWVGDVDPTIRPGDLVGGTDDLAVVVGSLAMLTIVIEIVAVATGVNRRQRIVPAVLILLMGAAWLARSAG